MADAPEGIVINSFGGASTTIEYSDTMGTIHPLTEVLALSKSQIETMDLLSEGPIVGPVSGEWIKTGVLGEIGWRSAIFTGFNTPNGYSSSKFLRSIYWNQVPVLGDDSKFNFQNVNIKFTDGKPNGEVIQVLSPFQTVSRSIGERLRAGSANAKTYRIFNKDCRGVVVNVKFGSLVAYLDGGTNLGRARVDYSIDYKPIYANKSIESYTVGRSESIFGKIVAAGGYIRTTRIDFPSNFLEDPAFVGWEIKIQRVTPDATDSTVSNATTIDSITEIQGNIYTFPNSAMVRSLFDAEYFVSVPERSFDTELLKVKIPGNYNPILKTYSGQGFATTNGGWNGEFATGRHWTDNPAWCYYDLLTSKRYGLGKYIDADLVDTTSLYQIGQYCDALVSDGFGGLEPRFTCNLWLTQKEEAYKVVNDMASIFRGMTYYSNGSIFAVQDSPKNEGLIFTNANVEEGNFTYSSSSRKSRNSIAIIRYNDPKNFYQPAIEYVEDFESIRKYGIREVELTAFGCTSRGQAIRLGRWALLSDKLETESVTFTAGIAEAAYLKPGDVFKIHDRNRKVKRYGGRTVSVTNIANTGSDVVLDYLIDTEPTVEYKLSFLTPSFNYDPTQVSGLNSNDYSNIKKSFLQEFYFSGFQSQASGSRTVVNLYSGFNYADYHVTGGQVWMMELSDRYESYTGNRYFANNEFDYYRTLNIVEKETHKFEITALQYNPQKYIEIESGLLFQKDVSNLIKIPASPYGLSLNVYNIASNLKTISYSFLVDDLANIDTFKVYVRTGQNFPTNGVPDNSFLIANLPNYVNNGTHSPTQTGNFFFRIFASNDKQSILSPNYTSGMATIYNFDPIQDAIISSLQVNNITGLYSGSSSNGYITVLTDNDANPDFTWQVGSNNPYLITGNLKYRATVRTIGDGYSRIPTSGHVYEQTGLTTPNFSFSLDDNIASFGGPYRSYQVVVEAHDDNGKTSAGNQIGNRAETRWHNFPQGYDIISIDNPRFTGAEMSLNVPTEAFLGSGFSGVTGSHASYQYITSDGYASIQMLSGQFDYDLVGGFLYVSTGKFPKYETQIRSGEWRTGVLKTSFDFNPVNGSVLSLNAAINARNNPYAYGSISFYDEVDKAMLDKGIDISTGLYLSNNFILINNSYFSSQSGPGNIYIKKVTGTATGISDSIISNGLSDGEVLVDYIIVGNKTNILYMVETYNSLPAFTGIPELPNLLEGGSVSDVEVAAMTQTFDSTFPGQFPSQCTIMYDHPKWVISPVTLFNGTTQSSWNLKSSGDLNNIKMSGDGTIYTSYYDGAINTWSITTVLNATYANAETSSVTTYSTLQGGISPVDFTVELTSLNTSGGLSSSPLIANIMEYQKYPVLG